MSQILEALVQRKSVRTFKDKPVGEEMVQLLLRAAACAPSWGDARPWHFVVLEDIKIITRIPEFHPESAVLLKCPLAIALFGEPQREGFPGSWPLDCAAAMENVLLQAQALHLGAVWLGVYPHERRMHALEALLEVPPHIRAFGVAAVGHPGENPSPREERFDPSRVHYGSWRSTEAESESDEFDKPDEPEAVPEHHGGEEGRAEHA